MDKLVCVIFSFLFLCSCIGQTKKVPHKIVQEYYTNKDSLEKWEHGKDSAQFSFVSASSLDGRRYSFKGKSYLDTTDMPPRKYLKEIDDTATTDTSYGTDKWVVLNVSQCDTCPITHIISIKGTCGISIVHWPLSVDIRTGKHYITGDGMSIGSEIDKSNKITYYDKNRKPFPSNIKIIGESQ